jgi:prepilin-type N-terminal cleavage/methylation domain-containing protein
MEDFYDLYFFVSIGIIFSIVGKMNAFFLKNGYGKAKEHSAFTLLELMVAIATIAILMSLIFPAWGKARRSMRMNQSKIQFNRYVLGLNSYYREYGYFPQILEEGIPLISESIISIDGTSSTHLILALSGREIDGVNPLRADHEYLNPNGVQFMEFSDDDFWKKNNEIIDRTRLADRFNNPHIKLIIESDSDPDVLIPQEVFNDYVTIKAKVPAAGLREKIAIFSVGDNDKSIDVISWKSE